MALKKTFTVLYAQRYVLFMIACLLLMFSTAIPYEWRAESMMFSVILAFHIFAGTMLWYQASSRIASMFFYLGLLLIAFQFLEGLKILHLGEVLSGLYVLFFFAVSVKIYRDIYKARIIDSNMVFAVFTGLILLGIMATFLFITIERVVPDSFRGMDPTMSLFDNLLYFSFISLLTIGYGDMVPATAMTKTLSVLVGLVANFYTIIVTGIVIGKYLGPNDPDKDEG
ncbi:MAG: ion channel [Bacteroidota bacterium]